MNTKAPKRYFLQGVGVLVAKSADGRVWAFEEQCNHADKSMARGVWDAQAATITCPYHKAVFAIADGGVVKAPPACVPLSVFPTEIVRENEQEFVYVDLPV